MSDHSGDDDKRHRPRKKIKPQSQSEKRLQRFRDDWLSDPDIMYWLEKDSSNCFKAKCKLCNKSMTADISVLKTHGKSTKHIENYREEKSSGSRMTAFLQTADKNPSQLETATKHAEIKIAGFLSEHNISFHVLDHLTDLLKSAFPDSKIAQNMAFKRTKGTAIITNVIGETEKSQLTQKLKETKFSVLTDESTDISSTKSSCILVRYYDPDEGRVTSKFWDLVQVLQPGVVSTATAQHLYQSLRASFNERGIPSENIIGFGSDGCNVMMGKNNSVSSRLKEDFPGITIVKCLCHSLHLCASESCKKLPRTVEEFARQIFNFFSSSAKRQSEYVEFQIFADTEVHKLLHPSQTRWLSLTAVVDRILEQWDALQLYFNEKWLDQQLTSAETINKGLHDPFMKMYFHFLHWILPKFTEVNRYFQSNKIVITEVHEAMTSLYIDLLSSYMKLEYINHINLSGIDPSDSTQYKPVSQMYLGVDVMNDLKNPLVLQRQDLLDYFYSRCREFLVQACTELLCRYDFSNSFFAELKMFKPKIALSRTNNERKTSMASFLATLPRVIPTSEYQKIDDEWRQLPFYNFKDENLQKLEPDIFWGKLLTLKNDADVYLFKNLARCALNVLSLPHSNADSERVFSKINLAKTKTRNRLIVRTLRGLLLSSQHREKTERAHGAIFAITSL